MGTCSETLFDKVFRSMKTLNNLHAAKYNPQPTLQSFVGPFGKLSATEEPFCSGKLTYASTDFKLPFPGPYITHEKPFLTCLSYSVSRE